MTVSRSRATSEGPASIPLRLAHDDAIAAGPIADRVLDGLGRFVCAGGVNRQRDLRLYAAQKKTNWGKRCQRLFALTENEELLASAQQYDLAGVLDGVRVRICGIGSVVSYRPQCDDGRRLVNTLLDNAAGDGAHIGLVFSHTEAADDAGAGADVIRFMDTTIRVAQSARHGAPTTTVRGGEVRDLAAIVAMRWETSAPSDSVFISIAMWTSSSTR